MRLAPHGLASRHSAGLRRVHGEPRLAIVTCIKNEGDDLVEWLCFHRQIGVSRFVIYDNLSTDATAAILASVPFRDEIVVHRIAEEEAQKAAFADAIERYRDELDWVAFIDGDEFIVPLGGMTLPEKLAEFQGRGVDGFGIHWRVFGSAGFEERPAGLLTRSFTRRARDRFRANRHVKSVVRIAAVRKMVTQHFFQLDGTYLLDDGSEPSVDFKGVTAGEATFTQGFAIHHYITKSRAQCFDKIARGRPRPTQSPSKYRPPSYWTTYDRNEVRDDRAAAVIEPIREYVVKLRKTTLARTRRERRKGTPGRGTPQQLASSTANRSVYIVLGLYRPDPDLLSRQLESIVSQTYRSVEILVSPDGPMDPTARAVIADFSRSPVHVLGFGDRVGIHANFARGLGAALSESGSDKDLFAFCDQDDLWRSDKLERQIACFKDPQTSLCHSDARIVAREGKVLVPSLFEHEARSREASLADLLVMNSVSGMTAVFRRDVAQAAGRYPLARSPYLLHDHWVALVASLLGSIRFIDEPLADYTQHAANVMGARTWQERPPRRGTPKDRRGYLRKSYREFLWRRRALNELRRVPADAALARARLDDKIVGALFDCDSGRAEALALLVRYRLGGRARQADQVWRIIRGKSLFCSRKSPPGDCRDAK